MQTTLSNQEVEQKWPVITLYHIKSDIRFRYAVTVMLTELVNNGSLAKELTFMLRLPKKALISNFTLESNGKVVQGVVKTLALGEEDYSRVQRTASLGAYISAKPRNTHEFVVSVNVPARSSIACRLQYEELLERRLGTYHHVLDMKPGQIAPDYRVDVYIEESQPVVLLEMPKLRTRNAILKLANDTDNGKVNVYRYPTTDSGYGIHLSYYPSPRQQAQQTNEGIDAQLVIKYDVERRQDAGELQVFNGHFVHYFAPSGFEPINKHVVFILDVSGSMRGDRIKQLQEAMYGILQQLQRGDFLNIIAFNTLVQHWQGHTPKPYSPQTLISATEFISNMTSRSSTNINAALLDGVTLFNEFENLDVSQGLVFFLTDGDPTAGEKNATTILNNINVRKQGLRREFSIFSLGFGDSLDFSFLEKLSQENNGRARKIYTGEDAVSQLTGFYSEISKPVLSKVKVVYLDDRGEELDANLTQSHFFSFFNGSEIVVSGKLRDRETNSVQAVVTGDAKGRTIDYRVGALVTKDALMSSRLLERIWAYMTVKKLSIEALRATDLVQLDRIKDAGIKLSLQYNLVTPFTSIVVSEPEVSISMDRSDRYAKEAYRTRHKTDKDAPASINYLRIETRVVYRFAYTTVIAHVATPNAPGRNTAEILL
ncbi:PREDICTED: inter-alpha-trypsin inhibitor heavy chain H4-like, partial [Priapulus caudatus]|uniref:Inter-alpha-trypsin inhibitor heavy chain H4-like n=1 Tax=Priapulus caudatus TaxID=37621 RepID=A0ABM1EYX7_PRICU